jgi:hypothetical protein
MNVKSKRFFQPNDQKLMAVAASRRVQSPARSYAGVAQCAGATSSCRQLLQCRTRRWWRSDCWFSIKAAVHGLLTAGKAGVQLTWMDANTNGHVGTPQIGKPLGGCPFQAGHWANSSAFARW